MNVTFDFDLRSSVISFATGISRNVNKLTKIIFSIKKDGKSTAVQVALEFKNDLMDFRGIFRALTFVKTRKLMYIGHWKI